MVTNLGDHNSVTKPSASLHNTIFFCICNEGKGMMQPWFNAEMAERTPLRKLKLLVGSVGLEFQEEWREWISETNMYNTSPFGCASPFANIGNWKAGRPASNNSWKAGRHVQLTVAKSSIMTAFFCSCNERMGMMQPWFNAEMAESTRLSGSSSFW